MKKYEIILPWRMRILKQQSEYFFWMFCSIDKITVVDSFFYINHSTFCLINFYSSSLLRGCFLTQLLLLSSSYRDWLLFIWLQFMVGLNAWKFVLKSLRSISIYLALQVGDLYICASAIKQEIDLCNAWHTFLRRGQMAPCKYILGLLLLFCFVFFFP